MFILYPRYFLIFTGYALGYVIGAMRPKPMAVTPTPAHAHDALPKP